MDVGRTNCHLHRRPRRRPGTSKLYWQVGVVVFVAEHSSEANKSRDHSCTGRSWPPAFASAKSQDKRTRGRAGRPRPLARGGHRSIPGRIRPVSLRVKKLQYMPRPDSRFQPAPSLLGCLASRPRDRRPPCNSVLTATSSSLGSGLYQYQRAEQSVVAVTARLPLPGHHRHIVCCVRCQLSHRPTLFSGAHLTHSLTPSLGL
jgi:hypothetical protein